MRCDACGHLNPDGALLCGRCHSSLGWIDSADPGWLQPGHVLLERYHLDAAIGEGAMGQVFRATDLSEERTVAVKLLHPSLLRNHKARQRMLREAASLGRIRHPNVVAIHTAFEFEGILGLVLEFVHGGSLADRLGRGPLGVPESVTLLAGVLQGLDAVHAAGVTHRDLKSANILLTPEGRPKIADFGIARDATAGTLTGTGAQLGTPGYMSPEQITGGTIGPPTDIYAVGVLLCEVLTLSLPYDGQHDFEIFRAQVTEEPDLSRLTAAAPAELVAIVRRALARDPAERWPSALALAAALAEVAPRPRGAPPPPDEFDDAPTTEAIPSLSAALGERGDDRAAPLTTGAGSAAAVEVPAASPDRAPRRWALLLVAVAAIATLLVLPAAALGAFFAVRGGGTGALAVAVVNEAGFPVQPFELSVDGTVRCRQSPCEIPSLAATSHALGVVAEGHVPLSPAPVSIEAGRTTLLELRLVPAAAEAGARRAPTGDGTTEREVEAAPRVLGERAPLGADASAETSAAETSAAETSAAETSAAGPKAPEAAKSLAGSGYGWLAASSTPPSQVIIDGRALGLSPVRVRLLAGAHSVVFVHPELGRKATSAVVKADGEVSAGARF